MRKNILQHIGAIVSGRRNEEHLTQQQLAQQTGRGCYSLVYLNQNPQFFSKLNKVWDILI